MAVWDDPARNTLLATLLAVVRRHLPPGHRVPVDALNEWAEPGRRVRLLGEVGLGPAHTEPFSWAYRFQRFEDAWDLVSGMGQFVGLEGIAPDAREQIRVEFQAGLAPFC